MVSGGFLVFECVIFTHNSQKRAKLPNMNFNFCLIFVFMLINRDLMKIRVVPDVSAWYFFLLVGWFKHINLVDKR